ncbi:MAG TPA: LUD domain-containing protein [Dehalococcoidia bacterium]
MTARTQSDRLADFARRAEAAGAAVHHLDGAAAAVDLLCALAGPEGRAALTAAARTVLPGLARALLAASARPVDPADRPALASAGLGVSVAVAGIAETGSVLLLDLDPADRLTGMLPPVHAVLLDPAGVVPGLTEAAALLRAAASGPSYASLVTGPSRTADIERVLAVGVHGPRELHLLLTPGVRRG